MSKSITGRHPAKGGKGVSPSGNPAPFGGHPSKGALRPLYGRFASSPCPTYRRHFFGRLGGFFRPVFSSGFFSFFFFFLWAVFGGWFCF